MKKYQLLLLSVLSGLLLGFSWPLDGFSPLLLIAFTPLLYVRHYINNNREKFGRSPALKYSSLAFLIWNFITTYWIYYASGFGCAAAIIVNTILFSFVFHLADQVGSKLGSNGFVLTFPVFWITFELIHLDWELSWSWLNLGNGFSNTTWAVQWYEYTGAFGGSLWILASNILVFELFKKIFILKSEKNKAFYYQVVASTLVLFGPMILSLLIQAPNYSKNKQMEVVIVQPNIDPYNEKFSSMSSLDQLQKLIKLAEQKITPNTQYVIAPETAIGQNIFEEVIDEAWSMDTLKSFLARHKNIKLIIGLTSKHEFKEGEKLTRAARAYGDGSGYYEVYNTAMQMTCKGEYQFYHKSKLVAGAETMPFASVLKPLEKFALDFGGTTGTQGIQAERSVFKSSENISVGTAICYESIFGEFVSGYVKNGANFLAVITNDGWWRDTPGYRQHNSLSRLRAIETRRWVTRSANTGISSFIDPSGKIVQQSKWWEATAMRQNIYAGDKITFYVKYGDYIGKIAAWLSLMIGFVWLRNWFSNRKKKLS